jgi:hypothetical protein
VQRAFAQRCEVEQNVAVLDGGVRAVARRGGVEQARDRGGGGGIGAVQRDLLGGAA